MIYIFPIIFYSVFNISNNKKTNILIMNLRLIFILIITLSKQYLIAI